MIGNRSGVRKKRINIIASLNVDNINAPMYFEGSTNTEIFIHWLKKILIPTLKKGQIIVMDNASFHKSPVIKQLLENAGCSLLYLPPYSPDLNPIENYWAVLKTYIAKIKTKFDNFTDAIEHALLNEKRYFLS